MSEVGTIPDNEDKRPPDLIADQQANRASTDPISFADGRPPVLPPLTVAPGFEDVVREVATGTFRDLLKNVTINGVTPEVMGGSFNFAMSTEPSASVQFASLNPPIISEPIIPTEPIKPTANSAPINWLGISVKDEKRWDEGANRPVFGLTENRREGESYSAQVTREHSEFQQQRRAQRDQDELGPREEKRSGEGDRAYTERVNENRREALSDAEAAAVKAGDTSYFYKGFIPILFTRKDGQRKILARLDNTHSVVIEGAVGNERQGTLPPENGYYEAGGGGDSCIGLSLYTKTVGTPPNTTTEVWISVGTVAGQIPSGFDPLEGKSISSGGSGEVWAEVNINQIDGEIVSVAVSGGSSTPNNTTTSFYLPLGYYTYDGDSPTVANYGCGSAHVVICRNWFAVEPPFYQVYLYR